MNLLQDIYRRLEAICWLYNVGRDERAEFQFPVTFATTREEALTAFNSNTWADAKTEAQGDLTGYLAKHHYNAYGGHWNNLAKQSRALLEDKVKLKIAAALHEQGFPAEMIQPILTDINRAALEITRQKFSKLPVFFENLLMVYEAGRLPVGWNGSLKNWPAGNIIVF